MNETKLRERIENAVNAFFADEVSTENNSLTFSRESGLPQKQTSDVFAGKAGVLVKILKQTFLFLPGAFVLFNLSLILVVFSLNPPLGAKIFNPERLLVILLVSAFMTMFGLGNIKNVKHLIIPASIVLSAMTIGVFAAFLADERYGINIIENCGIYLLPLALITPVLAKAWVDNNSKDSD